MNATRFAPLALLLGCFTPKATEPSFEVLAFDNPLVQSTDVVLRPLTWDELRCPDGSAATLYAVYRTGLAEPAPVVIAFHAGALDFVTAPGAAPAEDTGTPTDTGATPEPSASAGTHAAGEDRLTAAWAGRKVFETFGMLPGAAADSAEVNLGALPAALADAGAFTLYPANCWGDLWHNEDGFTPNDWNRDGFHRQGRALAWAATRIMSRDAAERAAWREKLGLAELEIPLQGDGAGEVPTVRFVGLGEGGRAVAELLRRSVDVPNPNFPRVASALLDSTMDDLSPIAEAPAQYPTVSEALERIYFEQPATEIARFSLGSWFPERGATTFPLSFAWSSEDPQLPDATVAKLLEVAAARPDLVTVTNTGELAHVLLNDEDAPARAAVEQLLAP